MLELWDQEPWELFAACRGTDTDVFFSDTRAAKEVCSECVVIVDCLGFAIRANKQFGIWGGKTVNERNRIRRNAQRRRSKVT